MTDCVLICTCDRFPLAHAHESPYKSMHDYGLKHWQRYIRPLTWAEVRAWLSQR